MKKEKEKKKSGSKALSITDANDVNGMIQLAIKSKAGVEQLEKLMEMKYKHEAREAEKRFHEAFSQMQSELPIIKKTKDVKGYDKEVMWCYAPIESIVKQVLSCLNKYGFSYRWTESFEQREGFKRVTCHATHIAGHTEAAFVDVPIMQANKMTNSIQQAGSSSTYGKRYSFCNVFGIMVENDDDDSLRNKEMFDGNGKLDEVGTWLANEVHEKERETHQIYQSRQIEAMKNQLGMALIDLTEVEIKKYGELTPVQTRELRNHLLDCMKRGVKFKRLNNKEVKNE